MKSAWLLVLAVATVAGGRTPACADLSSERPNRMAFAEAMGRVKAGMATNEIVELVGLPDEKRMVQRGSPDPYGVSSIWCYGTDTNVSFPTLGCVYLDDNSAVEVYGGFGPAEGFLARPVREGGVSEREDVRQIPFDERELRRLLQVVDEAPPASAPGYDPLAVIRVANVLVGLGKEKALAVLQEYLRVADDSRKAREGLFLILRVMFDVPDDPGFMPSVGLGTCDPPKPEDWKAIPRFPIVLHDDIPFLMVMHWNIRFGCPERVETHVDYFRKHGSLRKHPLRPPDDILSSIEKLDRSSYTFPGDSPYRSVYREMVANQTLGLVRSVYPVDTDRQGYRFRAKSGLGVLHSEYFDQGRWTRLTNEMARLRMCWSEEKSCYVRRNKEQSH